MRRLRGGLVWDARRQWDQALIAEVNDHAPAHLIGEDFRPDFRQRIERLDRVYRRSFSTSRSRASRAQAASRMAWGGEQPFAMS
jgi:hypothetical protein